MSISINCSIDLTEEELLFLLRRRAGQIVIVSPPEETKAPESAGAIVVGPEGATKDEAGPEGVTKDEAGPEGVTKDEAGPSRLLEPIPEERIEAAASSRIPAALPPKPTRRAKSNGAEAPLNSTPLAPNTPPPQPEPLDEPAMRSLLSKVGAVHPDKVKAITDILEIYGGHRRLSECDLATWPEIARAASLILAEYSI